MKRILQSEMGQLPHLDSLTPQMRSVVKGTAVCVLAEYITKHVAKHLGVPLTADEVMKFAVVTAMQELKDEGSL